MWRAGPRAVLRAAGEAGLLDAETAASLIEALSLYRNVTQWLRLALDEGADPKGAAEGVKRRIANAAGLPDFAGLERELADRRAQVRRIFVELLGRRHG